MTTITESITDAIKKNLSAEVSATLQGVLAQGEQDAAALIVANGKAERLSRESEQAGREITTLQLKLKAHGEITVRENVVAERERLADVRELKMALEAEKRISAFAVDVVTKLVRNTEYRSSAFGTVPLAVEGVAGQYPSPGTIHQAPTNTTRTGEAA